MDAASPPLHGAAKGAGGPAAPVDALCMAAADARCDFRPARFNRRAVGRSDVLLDMKYCGICHTDVHAAQGHLVALSGRCYPCVPGHELAGVVAAVGADVTRVRVGDHVGVGCMVDSCLTCAACRRGEEQMCSKQTATYNGKDNGSGRAAPGPGAPAHTLGGYTDKFVVHERFAVVIPKSYPLECAGPVMCAGVTLFDPLRRYGATKGTRVGVVGLGGLGQMGIRLAKAMGCIVTAITRSAAKADFAKECGADFVIVSTSSDDMARARAARALDLVLNTIPVEHDYAPFTALLAPVSAPTLCAAQMPPLLPPPPPPPPPPQHPPRHADASSRRSHHHHSAHSPSRAGRQQAGHARPEHGAHRGHGRERDCLRPLARRGLGHRRH